MKLDNIATLAHQDYVKFLNTVWNNLSNEGKTVAWKELTKIAQKLDKLEAALKDLENK